MKFSVHSAVALSVTTTFLAAAFLAGAVLATVNPTPGAPLSEKSGKRAGEAGVPASGSAELNESQCRELYEHQMKIAFQDQDNPLMPALRMSKKELTSDVVREAQQQHCLKHVNLANYRCQLAAASMLEIMQCHRKHPAQSVTEKENGTEKKIRTDHITDKAKIVGVKFTVGDCERTYDHLLAVHGSSGEFMKRKDSEELLRRWTSPAARESFKKRCLKAFQSRDLNCILSTRDPVVIQACLLRVPP